MFEQLNGVEIFFLTCALIGSVFVLVRLVLQFTGLNADTDFSGVDGHLDGEHLDPDAGFKALSLHGFTSFLMMFGLVGFAVYRDGAAGLVASLAAGLASGALSVWIIGRMFRAVNSLQSNGTVIIEDAIGSTGTVYLTIPATGSGRVTVSFKSRLREFDAVGNNGIELRSGTAIKVIGMKGNVLVVERNE